MFCSKWEFKLDDNAKFCSRCGSPTAQVNQSATKKKAPARIVLVAVFMMVAVAIILTLIIGSFGKSSPTPGSSPGTGFLNSGTINQTEINTDEPNNTSTQPPENNSLSKPKPNYANSKISGAESIDELIEILNNNTYISAEAIYTMSPMIATLFVYGETDYSESNTVTISKMTCSQIQGMINSNVVPEEVVSCKIHITDYKKLNERQIDFIKRVMHSDSFGWYDDVEEMWQTTGYITTPYGREELNYIADDETDADFDCTLGIIKKGNRYYWIFTG